MAINWLNPPQATPRDLAVLGGFGQFPNRQPQSTPYGLDMSTDWGLPGMDPFGRQLPSQDPAVQQRIAAEVAALKNNQMMNWEQSSPPMPIGEAMAGMPDLYRQAAQQQYSHQPMADSFLRRFGQPMVEQQQPMLPQQDVLQALMAQGNMIHALTNADARGAGTSFDQTARGGEGEVYYGGDELANQPWLDEFAAAGRAGVDLPMLHGKAGKPNEAMKAGIAERRQQRLGTPVPMADRQAAVRQKALIKSEQRDVRMGDMDPQEAYFNQAGRFAGGMGEGGGDFLNGIFFGGQTAADMQGNRLKAQEAQKTREWAGSPAGLVAGAVASGGPVPDIYSVQQMLKDPVGFAMNKAATEAPDFKTFAAFAAQQGVDPATAKQRWIAAGKPDPDAPGFWSGFWDAPKFEGFPDWMGINTVQ